MHAKSGLTERVRESTIDRGARPSSMVLDYVRKHVPEASTAPLAGNSIATDRGFIARDMPDLDAYLHYRMVDVSTIKELCRRWYPRVYFAQPPEGHGPPRAGRHQGVRSGSSRYYREHGVRPAARADRRAGAEGRDGGADSRPRLSRYRWTGSVDGGCSSAGRAPGCGPGCRGFESRHSPHWLHGIVQSGTSVSLRSAAPASR